MFRNLQEDDKDGFVNEGLEIHEGHEEANPSPVFNHTNAHTKIEISRSKYDQESLFREMVYKKAPSKPIFEKQCAKINKKSLISCFFATFPIFSWLSSYKQEDFIGDVISGCTVAIMHIPQGMGYALLASLPPVVGIYVAFYPVFLYVIFGTSRHNSMGTFAVVSIMLGKTITTYSYEYSDSPFAQQAHYSAIEIASLVCLIVGGIQLVMYVLRLGILSFLLSECLVSGFTTAAAFHVFTSQVKDLLGLQLPRTDGNFKLIKTYYEIFSQIDNVNGVVITISATTILILLLNNELLKPRVAKKTVFPIPIELIVVIGGTLLSKYMNMHSTWGVIPVGHIPVGLPDMTVPRLDLWKELLLDSFAIAFVSYSITVSMALIFGQKLKYEIDFNQELLAMGSGNVLGSFFSCLPISASLSRSLIQQTVGGRTQMASLISCSLLLFVLLWIGPFFEELPRCILASIIVVALKGMLMQVADFPRFKRRSNIDGFIWLATLLSVIVFSIDIGLIVGIGLSVMCLFCNGLSAHMCTLGNVPKTDLFLDIDKFQKAIELPYVKIIHFSGSINFATKASFKRNLCDRLGIDLLKELKKVETEENGNVKTVKNGASRMASDLHFKQLVLDFSGLSNIDASSVDMLSNLVKDFKKLNVKVSITSCSTRIYEILMKTEFSFMNHLYPSIQDSLIERRECP